MPSTVSRVRGGIAMHGACSTAGLAAAWLLQATTRWRVEPFSRRSIPPELPDVDWRRWKAEYAPSAAAPNRWVVGTPGDKRRRRFHLLLLDDSNTPVGFAKFSTNPLSEFALGVRKRLDGQSPSTFMTPALLGFGSVGDWQFTVDEPIPLGFHRPARLSPASRRTILDEIRRYTRSESGQDAVHGDFGPWNVRSIKGYPPIVLDWEEAMHGPAGADELWHALNVALLHDRRSSASRVFSSLDPVSQENVVESAEFLGHRLNRPEPEEVLGTVPLSPAGRLLLAAQRAILKELSAK